jgi:hypothetical protein
MTTANHGPIGSADEQVFLKYLSCHIVAICGKYTYLDENGHPTGAPKYYSYTGTICDVLGSWVIVTAGHVLRNLEAASKRPLVRIEAEASLITVELGRRALFRARSSRLNRPDSTSTMTASAWTSALFSSDRSSRRAYRETASRP